MDIDLTPLHSHVAKQIDITNYYTIPESFFGTTGVKKLENIKVDGYSMIKVAIAASTPSQTAGP